MGFLTDSNALQQPEKPPPGTRVDVGGYQLHIWCMGEGSPTVVLEAALASFCLHWNPVQTEVAKFTSICAYDRAGLGWSDPSPHPRAPHVIVGELHTLLTNGDIQPPYVLVGHSMGSIYVRQYARVYPDEIVGIVLVDGAHESQNLRMPPERQRIIQTLIDSNAETFQRYVRMTHEQIVRETLAYRSAHSSTPFSQEIETLFLDRLRPKVAQAMLDETLVSQAILAQNLKPLPSLGNIPLIVLTAGSRQKYAGVSDEMHEQGELIWLELQRELAATSSNSTHRVIQGSSHLMPVDKPQAVVDAIRELVDDARRGKIR